MFGWKLVQWFGRWINFVKATFMGSGIPNWIFTQKTQNTIFFTNPIVSLHYNTREKVHIMFHKTLLVQQDNFTMID